jgi:hypothetical protein
MNFRSKTLQTAGARPYELQEQGLINFRDTVLYASGAKPYKPQGQNPTNFRDTLYIGRRVSDVKAFAV